MSFNLGFGLFNSVLRVVEIELGVDTDAELMLSENSLVEETWRLEMSTFLGVVYDLAGVADIMWLIDSVDFATCVGLEVTASATDFCLVFLVTLAAVVVSNNLPPPNNARHKLTPNPAGACVVVFGLVVVLGLAVMTTGLVVVTGVVGRVDAVVLTSTYFFVVDPMLLTLGYGNRSIIIGSEGLPNDGRLLMELSFIFELRL